jgi:hypothetical protein
VLERLFSGMMSTPELLPSKVGLTESGGIESNP